jgi:hypothetical protein
MSTRDDPLIQIFNPENQPLTSAADRLFYATGVLLDARDFQDEQLYHRGRLARALAYLHGYGTVCGLRVAYLAGTDTTPEQLEVRPGLAVDRLGRLIELPRPVCIRLDRWYEQQDVDQLRQALYSDITQGVFADVFARFVVCSRGKTPAFPDGPFDAIDAVQPSRLRDAYEVSLLLRPLVQTDDDPPQEALPPLPVDPYQAVAGAANDDDRRATLREAIFNAWREGTADWREDAPEPAAEHLEGQDATAVFLARIHIPAMDAGPDQPPERDLAMAVIVDNHSRPFLLTAPALASWLGINLRDA